MKVSTSLPFKLVYSLYQHEYLGYCFGSYVIQEDKRGQLTLSHQNISYKNASEFASKLDEVDYQLIKIIDSMEQDAVLRRFSKKKIKADEFFLKIYDKQNGNPLVQREINLYLERRRAKILSLLTGKSLYEMGHDGEPAWKEIQILPHRATVLFHFRRNTDNTHYFPTIKYDGQKVDFIYNGAYIICNSPACSEIIGVRSFLSGLISKPFA